MPELRTRNLSGSEAEWRSAMNYGALLHADRRGFAWEWLRRHAPYRAAWKSRARSPRDFGLLSFEDPDHALPDARPIWSFDTDPSVLASKPAPDRPACDDMLDIRRLARYVSVEIDERDVEHWLLSDGQWIVRLDLHDGTLLGGPVPLQHQLVGFSSAEPTIRTVRQLGALANRGRLPVALRPREARAARWVLELRTADALACGATHQDMARAFFGASVAPARWRIDSGSFRVRVQRLVRAARRNLDDPLSGPWFRGDRSLPRA